MIDAIHFVTRILALILVVGAAEMFALVVLERIQWRRAQKLRGQLAVGLEQKVER
jgi:hypothetical protein